MESKDSYSVTVKYSAIDSQPTVHTFPNSSLAADFVADLLIKSQTAALKGLTFVCGPSKTYTE